MLRETFQDLWDNGLIGDWCFVESENGLSIYFRYPMKEKDAQLGDFWPYSKAIVQGDIVRCPLTSKTETVWHWDGNREAPTLSPSILVKNGDHSERWHGFLRNGKLETV